MSEKNKERVLIERACSGDLEAFMKIADAHKKHIYYLALDLSGNHHSAEDISQEVLMRAFRALKNFKGNSRLSSWFYRITVNTFLTAKGKEKKTSGITQDIFEQRDKSYTANPERLAEASRIKSAIDSALQRLSPRERTAFVLKQYHELRLSEIAKIMRISEGTVKSLLFRAIRKLRNELKQFNHFKEGIQQ